MLIKVLAEINRAATTEGPLVAERLLNLAHVVSVEASGTPCQVRVRLTNGEVLVCVGTLEKFFAWHGSLGD